MLLSDAVYMCVLHSKFTFIHVIVRGVVSQRKWRRYSSLSESWACQALVFVDLHFPTWWHFVRVWGGAYSFFARFGVLWGGGDFECHD